MVFRQALKKHWDNFVKQEEINGVEYHGEKPHILYTEGFSACYRWLHGQPEYHYCEKCRRKTYPNHGECAFCKQKYSKRG